MYRAVVTFMTLGLVVGLIVGVTPKAYAGTPSRGPWGVPVQDRTKQGVGNASEDRSEAGVRSPVKAPGWCRDRDPIAGMTVAAADLVPGDCGYQAPAGDTGISTVALAQREWAKLGPPAPVIRTAPPRGAKVLVQMPTWFWLDRSQWSSRADTARAGSAWVTITASASTLVIDPGDGSDPFTCAAPGLPYDETAEPDDACTHTYRRSGTYTVRVTANWDADWTGSDNTAGELRTIGRTATFTIPVVSARSELIDGS